MEQRDESTQASASLFKRLKTSVLFLLVFFFPLFFLLTTQEFFVTNKMYLLAFGGLLLIVLSTMQFLVEKRFVWRKNVVDNLVAFFLVAMGLSIILSSPNKVEALLSNIFGFTMIAALGVLYYFVSRHRVSRRAGTLLTRLQPIQVLSLSGVILSIITIVFFFQPFKNVAFPASLQFLKNPTFTPLGGQLDLALFLGFFIVFFIGQIISGRMQEENPADEQTNPHVLNAVFLGITGIAFALTVFSLVQPLFTGNPQNSALGVLPPFRLSWYAAIEILKHPMSALFGVGVDNFSSVYTQVKDVAYNQSPLWQISSFVVSRSAVLHVLSETGLIGLIAMVLMLGSMIRAAAGRSNRTFHGAVTRGTYAFLVLYLLAVVIFFPPSLPVFFLLFLVLGELAQTAFVRNEGAENVIEADLSALIPVYLGIALVVFAVVAVTTYALGRSYVAEYYFKKSFDGILANNAAVLYNNQRDAIIQNPYIERFRTSFSQTNLLIANNIAARATSNAGDNKQATLSEQDRNTIAQAIQAAISEAKAAVALNPLKAGNWENLAAIYRNVLNVAQGADVWTVASYQRAIVLDPQNPAYRLNLGGVYFSVGNYAQAAQLFDQAVQLKPDWANAYYNLAWSLYQAQDYQRAILVMQNVQALLNPQKDAADYKRVQQDIAEFQKKLPQQTQTTPETQTQAQNLALPTPPVATISPKIQLPKTASPGSVLNQPLPTVPKTTGTP